MAKTATKIARTPAESLKLLWGKKFFKTWKKYSQIVQYLSTAGYHFSTPELGMALKRAKYLTRRGRRGNYEYIQKHPFFEEDAE
jgi:hypothetical protein